jgi:hypothetical protein
MICKIAATSVWRSKLGSCRRVGSYCAGAFSFCFCESNVSLVTTETAFFRFFKRVDGSVACIRDSRLFHEFGSSKVYMDLLWQEQNLQPPPASSEATVRPTSALGSLPAVPPNQQRDVNAWSRVLPDVTLKSKVHKNFELDLVA